MPDRDPSQLSEAEEIVEALRRGEVDAVVEHSRIVMLRLQETRRDLRASEERLHLAADAAAFGTFHVNHLRDETRWSGELKDMCGLGPDDDVPLYWPDGAGTLVHEEDRERVQTAYQAGLDPAGPGEFETEHRIVRPDGHVLWVLGRARTYFEMDENGSPVRARTAGVVLDITTRIQRENHMKMVMAELNHRVKNTLAVIQAMAKQAIKHADSLESFQEGFVERLRSIGKSHSLLTATGWSGACLHDILASELQSRAISASQCTLTGPDVMLPPDSVLAMHMVIHELSTNSAKYGTLRSAEGTIDVRWAFDQDRADRVILEWTEQSPAGIEPTNAKSGYGSRLIDTLMGYELDGSVHREYREHGLHCRLEIGLVHLDAHESRAPVSHDQSGEHAVLIVEDRGLLAKDLAEDIEGEGFTVIGPVSDETSVRQLAEQNQLSAAILDVDLGGRVTVEIARYLRSQGVPLFLATGYERRDLPLGLRGEQMFRKPVVAQHLARAIRTRT